MITLILHCIGLVFVVACIGTSFAFFYIKIDDLFAATNNGLMELLMLFLQIFSAFMHLLLLIGTVLVFVNKIGHITY